MTDTITDVNNPRKAAPDSVAEQFINQARAEGVSLVGPGSPLVVLSKQLLETALEAELDEHFGYEHGDRPGKLAAGGSRNERNGSRVKTVLTELGPVKIDVPRGRDGSSDPVVVRKRQRRLTGVDEMVLSLWVKGLTTGEIAGFFAEAYGQELSKDTTVQTCVIHLLRNTFKYAARQHLNAISRDIKPVYTAPTAAAAARFDEFTEKWGGRYPEVIKLWHLSRPEPTPSSQQEQHAIPLRCGFQVGGQLGHRQRLGDAFGRRFAGMLQPAGIAFDQLVDAD